MRPGAGAVLAMVALLLGGCGVLTGVGESAPSTPMNLCCHGYDPERLTRMAGVTAATAGRDQLAVRDGAYLVRVDAAAISDSVPKYLTDGHHLYYAGPLRAPAAGQEVLLALLSLDQVRPAPRPRDGVSTDSKIMALAPDGSGGAHWYVDLLHGFANPPTHQTVVVALIVPRGGTAVLCASVQIFGEPRLDLRTGRVTPGVDKVNSCEPSRSPAPVSS
jgi:hypothetical protein